MLGLEKLGFPGGTPSVAVDISGVNNSFQVEVGIEFYPADPFRGVVEYGSMDDLVNGWFAWNPPLLFLVACFGVAFWRNVDERRGKGVYDQGRDEKKARITRAGGAPRGVEGAWHDGVSSRYRRQAGIPRGLRDCR